jgi:hypothetical protein
VTAVAAETGAVPPMPAYLLDDEPGAPRRFADYLGTLPI